MVGDEIDDAEESFCTIMVEKFYVIKPDPKFTTTPFFLGKVKKRGQCPESGLDVAWVQYWELIDGEVDFYTGHYHPNALHPNGCRFVVGSFVFW